MRHYKTLYIIGNGLDLHYGIPTRYSDFGEYVRQHDEYFHFDMSELFPGTLWRDFESALGEITADDVTADVFGLLSFNPDSDFAFEQESAAYNYHLEALKTVLDLRRIKKLFAQWVATIPIPDDLEDGLIKDGDQVAFLVFNYTQTIEKALGVNPNRVLHIHGVQGDDDLVIGHAAVDPHRDEQPKRFYELDAIEDERVRFIELSVKPTEALIERNTPFFDNLHEVDEVVVIGYSFSDVDQPYIDKIKRSVRDDCRWHVYLHEFDALKLQAAIGDVMERIGCNFTISLL